MPTRPAPRKRRTRPTANVFLDAISTLTAAAAAEPLPILESEILRALKGTSGLSQVGIRKTLLEKRDIKENAGTLSRTISRMEKRGLLLKKPGPDARSLCIQSTRKGLRELQERSDRLCGYIAKFDPTVVNVLRLVGARIRPNV